MGLIGFSLEEQQKTLLELLASPHWERLWHVAAAIRRNIAIEKINENTGIDLWFLHNIKEIVDFENTLKTSVIDSSILKKAKELGYSDIYLSRLLNRPWMEIARKRENQGIQPVYKRVDTCAAEFEAHTPYLYSTYEEECEAAPTDRKKIMILGGGPNRIGQGIEFDYCCVHASFALKEDGFETIMVNCNPETVSTDYDTSDRLYFEPLTFEDVMNIIRVEKPDGVIVQFGGQTPLRLALALKEAGAPIIGTSPDDIDRAEDRKRFKEVLEKLGLKQPANDTATSLAEAERITADLGYPAVVRPSYVLGGRAMEIVYDDESLRYYMEHAVQASPEHPILIDKFLENAIEVDVDALRDGERVVIGGVMEHIEMAGIHSGDSACSLPPVTLPEHLLETIKQQTRILATELNVIGLINIQFAIKDDEVYILEVNPRASRTVPFVSKAIGIPLAKLAARVMAGKTLEDLGFVEEKKVTHISVKESVFPFIKFSDVDVLLGPEMKSTGEVMGIDSTFARAFAKSQIATGLQLPSGGTAFVSVKDEDKSAAVQIGEKLHHMGFSLVATSGTAKHFQQAGLPVTPINKVKEGSPHIVEAIESGKVALIINTTFGKQSILDSFSLRRACLTHNLPYFTTLAGAFAIIDSLEEIREHDLSVISLQECGKS